MTADEEFYDWSVLVGRKPVAIDDSGLRAALTGKRVLVTGAGGSIGSALAHAIAACAPRHLLLLEAAEHSLYEIHRALEQPHTPVLGSICDRATLADLFTQHRPQVVFHAAAFKHVPLMEQNPFAAIQNNALGTYRLAQAAAAHGVEQFIFLSTDKAADPVSIMGVSKRLAELVLLARPDANTRNKIVRLGNVLASRGSVVPLFVEQIARGGPVTVTHPDARRYFLTMKEAVELLLAACIEPGSGILVPELDEPVLIEKLARHLIARFNSAKEIPITFCGLRLGDKMIETLLSSRESYASSGPLRRVLTPSLSPTTLERAMQDCEDCCRERNLVKLVEVIRIAVPEYQPSALLAEQQP